MLPALTAIFPFLAIVSFVVGARALSERRREPESRLRALARSEAKETVPWQSFLRHAPSSIPVLRAILSGVWGERLRFDLDRADLRLRPGEYVAMRLLLAVLFFLAGTIPLGVWPGVLLGALLGFF